MGVLLQQKRQKNITINASQPAADEWKYSISTAGASNITKVMFTLTVQGCSVKSIPLGWNSGSVYGGIEVEKATGDVKLDVTIQCDAVDGPNYIDVHVLGGTADTVRPISGQT